MKRGVKFFWLCLLAICTLARGVEPLEVNPRYAFTDEGVTVTVATDRQELPLHISTITVTGFEPKRTMTERKNKDRL